MKYSFTPEIRISAIDHLLNSTNRLTITAPANVAYRLDALSNLLDWTPLTNFPPLPFTSIQFFDAQLAGPSARFYRTVWSP